jgi:hypothetical protein
VTLLAIGCEAGYRLANNGKFKNAKVVVPQCLDMCDPAAIRRFKTWRTMDEYRYVSTLWYAHKCHKPVYMQQGPERS